MRQVKNLSLYFAAIVISTFLICMFTFIYLSVCLSAHFFYQSARLTVRFTFTPTTQNVVMTRKQTTTIASCRKCLAFLDVQAHGMA